jgi:hypothetical protein
MRKLFLAALLVSYSALAADVRLDPGVRIGTDGTAMLASSRISVSNNDRYHVQVKLLEGSRVLAEEQVRYPH